MDFLMGLALKVQKLFRKKLDIIEINPKRSAKIYKNRAYLREKLNKNSDAREDLKSYLKYFPKAPDRGIIEQAIREI